MQIQNCDKGKSKYKISDDEFVIRKMHSNDIDMVMQIWRAINIKTHDFIAETYWREQYDSVKKIIPESEVYVCERSKQIIGFIGLSENYVAGLFVALDFQSHGIGKKLLDYVKRFKSELYLYVYSKNHRAVKFYFREGFVVDSENIDENTGEKEFMMRASY